MRAASHAALAKVAGLLVMLGGVRCFGPTPACTVLLSVTNGLDGDDPGLGVEVDEMLDGAKVLRDFGCGDFVAADDDLSRTFDAFEDDDAGFSLEPDEIKAILATTPDEAQEKLLACVDAAVQAVCGPANAASRKRKLNADAGKDLGILARRGLSDSEIGNAAVRHMWFSRSAYQPTAEEGGENCDAAAIDPDLKCHIREFDGYVFQRRLFRPTEFSAALRSEGAAADIYQKKDRNGENNETSYECLIAFRGTDDIEDLILDAETAVTAWGEVNSGTKLPSNIYRYYRSLAEGPDGIEATCKGAKRTISTGHSLGAAAAIAMGHDYINRPHSTWAFASPKIVRMNRIGWGLSRTAWECPVTLPDAYSFYNVLQPLQFGSVRGVAVTDVVPTLSTCLRTVGGCQASTCVTGNYELHELCPQGDCNSEDTTRTHTQMADYRPLSALQDATGNILNGLYLHSTRAYLRNLLAWSEKRSEARVADGTRCMPLNQEIRGLVLDECSKCSNEATWWWSKGFFACGAEPRWSDGMLCVIGLSCEACMNPATHWWSKALTACGPEEMLETGKICFENRVCASGKCDLGFCVDCLKSGTGCSSQQYCDLGRCKNKHGFGAACVEDRVCQSGVCWFFSCTTDSCKNHICFFGDVYGVCNKDKCCRNVFGDADCTNCC